MATHHMSSAEVALEGGYDALYAARPPWEIAGPQPALAAVAEAGLVRGRVLDAGCGTGEHALMAAVYGGDALGVDLSEAALTQARAKAGERGLAARFVRHDVLKLGDLGERFEVVLDSLLFHGFHGPDRACYVESLAAALNPGGRLFVLCFAEEPPGRPGRVHRVTPDEIEAAFASGWRIEAIDAVTVASALPSLPDGLRGWRAAITRI
ncbi:MAG TPA: class I SAM-dependent methyltransferase [Actinocrinis sp.]|nr:class I SAM-dependent methyltransferase [Actinocrinis sp.]